MHLSPSQLKAIETTLRAVQAHNKVPRETDMAEITADDHSIKILVRGEVVLQLWNHVNT